MAASSAIGGRTRAGRSVSNENATRRGAQRAARRARNAAASAVTSAARRQHARHADMVPDRARDHAAEGREAEEDDRQHAHHAPAHAVVDVDLDDRGHGRDRDRLEDARGANSRLAIVAGVPHVREADQRRGRTATEPTGTTRGECPRGPASASVRPPTTAPAPTAAISQPSPVASRPSTSRARAGIMMM